LFEQFVAHRYVPLAFGVGIIIQLVKGKSHILNAVDNYRAITSIPIVSKVLEHCLLNICEALLRSDELQFNFKQRSGLR
jgi:hypothetical protein